MSYEESLESLYRLQSKSVEQIIANGNRRCDTVSNMRTYLGKEEKRKGDF